MRDGASDTRGSVDFLSRLSTNSSFAGGEPSRRYRSQASVGIEELPADPRRQVE